MRKALLVVGAALAFSNSMTACSTTSLAAENQTQPAVAVSVATPTPTATPTPVEGDLDGNGILSNWEGEQLAKSTYALKDGTKVAIPRGEPLPKAVRKEVKEEILPGIVKSRSAYGDGIDEAFFSGVDAQEKKLNRKLLIVHIDAGQGRWTINDPLASQYPNEFATKAEATAVAKEFASHNPQYAVFVID